MPQAERVDFVAKLGGSLFADQSRMRLLLDRMHDIAKRTVFVVGSGPLGDAFLELGYSDYATTAGTRAVDSWSLLQSVNARVLCGLDPRFVLCSDRREIDAALENERSPVIDTVFFARQFSDLDDQMSDVRAAIVSSLLGCRSLVIVTNVDGIFESDPNDGEQPPARRIDEIDATDPLLRRRTSVDRGLAAALLTHDLRAYVVAADRIIESSEWNSVLTAASLIVPA